MERSQQSSPTPERAERLRFLADLDSPTPDPTIVQDEDLLYLFRFAGLFGVLQSSDAGAAGKWLMQALVGVDESPPACVFRKANIDPETITHDGSGWQADVDPRVGTDDRRAIAQLLFEAAVQLLIEDAESERIPVDS